MKKLFVAISMLFSSLAVQASPQIVEVVWPFAPGGSHATMIRNLIENANKQQSQYRFVFDNKPGAGGTVAANHVLSSSRLTVLVAASSFYARPLMFHASHDPTQFRLVSTLCQKTPPALFSRKYSSFTELKNRDVTVGVMPGSMGQLIVHALKQNHPEFKITEVYYKDTIASMTDMLGGHIDISFDMLGKPTLARLSTDTKVMGVSGTRDVLGAKSFASQGITGLDFVLVDFNFYLPRTVDENTARVINKIFNGAINDVVRQNCGDEMGVVELITLEAAETLHEQNQKQWRLITQGIVKQ